MKLAKISLFQSKETQRTQNISESDIAKRRRKNIANRWVQLWHLEAVRKNGAKR